MTTLIVNVFEVPDGLLCRCDRAPHWRPKPVQELDEAKMVRSLKGHVSKNTRVEFHGFVVPGLDHLGWDV